MGFYVTVASTELVNKMRVYNIGILLLDLIFNIVIILFVAISILLIYSLLMITTQTKTFDIGVMRLIGLSSYGFLGMITTQGVMFVLPSIICAYICSYPLLYLAFKKIFADDQGEVSFVPTAPATLEAVAIGLLIPMLSSIIPIQRALSKSLSESLNTARATLSGSVVTIESKGAKVFSIVMIGSLCVVSGFTIYILLPQALLQENANLILAIFFAILIGLIFGLTLLTSNIRGPIETIILYVLFFWERRSMRALLKKNMMAHKATNKITSIIYALTLGCVIFLCVSVNLMVNAVQCIGSYTFPDADIYITHQPHPN